tara:strand:+ start:402 stop:1247 length:846 start_codon:yes stop_codon:yes gene_type:complete
VGDEGAKVKKSGERDSVNEQAKAIFITGGGSGIGRAVAQRFAREGWHIGLADVNAAGLTETAALLPEGKASTHMMDVRDRAAWEATLAEFTAITGGRVDVLMNNAGIAVSGPFAQTDPAELERIVAINLMGVVHGAHVGYRHLKATPGACLVNTASAAGIWGSANAAIYSATKAGVRGLSESLDAEWAKDGIRVACLMPSFIDTPLLDETITGSNRQVRDQVRSLGLEFTPVEDVAERVWQAVHGDALHIIVGKTARRLQFGARFFPNRVRKQLRSRGLRR